MEFEFEDRLRATEGIAMSALQKIGSHEQLCAERYENIHSSLKTYGRVMFWAATTLITGMAAVLVTLLIRQTH